jgi:hypothetical protein
MANRKVYLLTEEQIGDVNYLLCIANKELKDNNTSRLVSKAINTLAQASFFKSDEPFDKVITKLLGAKMKGGAA